MHEPYASFAAALREQLPEGPAAVEITVPGRATRLIAVDYGSENGITLFDLTETTRRMRDLSEMSDHDFEYMGTLPGDNPSPVTMTFAIHRFRFTWEALPTAYVDHLAIMNESGADTDANDAAHPAGQDLVALCTANFERYRRLGLFGPKAVRIHRDTVPADSLEFHADLMAEHRTYTDMLRHKRRQLEERMTFLERCERERQASQES